jgi:hypothetical protein
VGVVGVVAIFGVGCAGVYGGVGIWYVRARVVYYGFGGCAFVVVVVFCFLRPLKFPAQCVPSICLAILYTPAVILFLKYF